MSNGYAIRHRVRSWQKFLRNFTLAVGLGMLLAFGKQRSVHFQFSPCKGKYREAGLGLRSSVGTSQLAEVSTKLYVGGWLRDAIGIWQAAVGTFPILPLQGEVPRSGVGVKKFRWNFAVGRSFYETLRWRLALGTQLEEKYISTVFSFEKAFYL
jgi:hypothetical protein